VPFEARCKLKAGWETAARLRTLRLALELVGRRIGGVLRWRERWCGLWLHSNRESGLDWALEGSGGQSARS